MKRGARCTDCGTVTKRLRCCTCGGLVCETCRIEYHSRVPRLGCSAEAGKRLLEQVFGVK